MERPFQQRPRNRRPALNITPLIDVMFLLLIFFMVTSTFRDEAAFDVTLPQAQSATSHEQAPTQIVVRAGGRMYLDGDAVTPEELRTALRQRIAEQPDASFVLRGDAEATYQQVVRALDIARDVGGRRLVLPMEPVRPPGQ
ncbi:MAG: ExbD/TolR family protein [Candidatus Hydrogenedentota bacterium]